MGNLIDLTGIQFKYLFVLRRVKDDKNYNTRWLCECTCGRRHIIYGDNLRRRPETSCGCVKGDKITKRKIKHGHSMNKTAEYRAWGAMINRCYNPIESKSKRHYYDKNITVCDRWLKSFDNFFLDMGKRPSDKHSLDRIDVYGNYEPNNCRWATIEVQANNKTINVWFEHDGVKMTQSNWAKLFNVNVNAIRFHLKKGKQFSEIYNHFMQES